MWIARGEPGGETDVVGVVVGDHDPPQWAAVCGEHRVPGFARLVAGEAAVDDGDRIAVVEQPQVDVVERKRKAHAHPAHARGDGDGLAVCGQAVERILEVREGGGRHGVILDRLGHTCPPWLRERDDVNVNVLTGIITYSTET
jgi:hypothetical protein